MATVLLEETNERTLTGRIADGFGSFLVVTMFTGVFLVLALIALMVVLLFHPKPS